MSSVVPEEYYPVADAVHRLAWAFDHHNREMFLSAFTEDGILDNRPLGARVGLEFPVLEGREAAASAILPMLGPLDTSHTVSNIRIIFTRKREARLDCNVMAQHFRAGEGPRPDTEYYLMMNLWSAELVHTDDLWRIRKLVVDCAWATGNIGIATGQ